jgi:hypothetical protein
MTPEFDFISPIIKNIAPKNQKTTPKDYNNTPKNEISALFIFFASSGQGPHGMGDL